MTRARDISNVITDANLGGTLDVSGAFTSPGIDDNADATAIAIDSGESVFIGNTAEFVDGTGTGDKGIQLNPLGLTVSTRNGGVSGIFGRQASDGTIVQFRKDGSEVGRIGYASATNIAFGNASKGIGVGTSSVFPTDGGTAISDTGLDLGYASSRFKDLYLSGGVRVGGTGSANLLDDYEEGTFNCSTSSSGYSIASQGGKYTKIGRLVHVNFVVNFSSVGTSNATVTITGLPFTVGNFGSAGSIRENSNSGAIYVINVPASNTEFSFNAMDGVSNNSNRRIHNNENYGGSFTYSI